MASSAILFLPAIVVERHMNVRSQSLGLFSIPRVKKFKSAVALSSVRTDLQPLEHISSVPHSMNKSNLDSEIQQYQSSIIFPPPKTHRLIPCIHPSTLSTHSSLIPSTCALSSKTPLNSPSNSLILSSCLTWLFSTPGNTPIRYSICFAFSNKSWANSRCAEAKVVGLSGRCSGGRADGTRGSP